MSNTVKTSASQAQPEQKLKKHIKLTEITYQRNIDSDYTEKIEELDRQFNYSNNRNDYWSYPELSTLYGSPLYEQASPSQRKALNHLYWVRQYHQTAATEANAILYNQVTAGVFANFGGYDTLCQELALETDQEHHHIHAFQKIGSKTKRALLGKSTFKNANPGLNGLKDGLSKTKIFASQPSRLALFERPDSPLSAFGEMTFRFLTNKVMLRSQKDYYSRYLRELDEKGERLPAQTTGLMGQLAPRAAQQFFTLNCGSSPFLACLFYVARFVANMLLKNYEYSYVQYYRELSKKGEFIPVPTAVSYYHLLDESFHTTTSQLIAQDLYKDFRKPTAYEKFIANATIYRAQTVSLRGLSGSLPGVFRSDRDFIPSLYSLLQSPVFAMSAKDAFYWLEECLCREHEGFHVNLKYHQRLLSDLRRFFDGIDYLWAVNREMHLMASGGSIAKAIRNNVDACDRFSRLVSSSEV